MRNLIITIVILFSAFFQYSWIAFPEAPESPQIFTMKEKIVEIVLPGHPFAVVAAPTESTLFISLSNMSADGMERDSHLRSGVAIVKGSPSRYHVARVIGLRDGDPGGMTISNDGKYLLVADNNVGIAIIGVDKALNGKSDAIIRYVGSEKGGSVEVAVSQDDRYAFASNETANTLDIIEMSKAVQGTSNPVIATVSVDAGPVGLALSGDGKYLFMTSQMQKQADMMKSCATSSDNLSVELKDPQEGTLTVFNVSQLIVNPEHSVVARVRAGCSPVRVSLSSKSAWVTARGSDLLYQYDINGLIAHKPDALQAALKVGRAPVGVATIEEEQLVLVANSNRFAGKDGRQTVSIVSIRDKSPVVIGTLLVGSFPREIALSRNRSIAYVSNFNSNSISVISFVK